MSSLVIAVACALAFALTNGLHDAANSFATLVATRGARPGQAALLSACFNLLGAVLVGGAVAGTIAGIVTVAPTHAVAVVGSGVLGAVWWNLLTWARGTPASSSHALVGGLVGSALTESGIHAVAWGGLSGWRPVGVFGVLIALAISPVAGLLGGVVAVRFLARVFARATTRVRGPVRRAEWMMTAALSFSHGANDAQKAIGVIVALLVATGHTASLAAPLWVKVSCGVMLTSGTAMGGWRIVRTVGRRIYRLSPLDGFASQTASTAVILASSYIGAPVSTTHVVASSVVGVGGGRRRWRHVRWAVVESMATAWVLTLPASAGLGAATYLVWKAVG